MPVNTNDSNQPNSEFPDDLPPDPFGPGDPFPIQSDDETANSASVLGANPDPLSGLLGGAFGSMLGPMLGNFAQMMAKQGPLPWETVTQIALMAATTDTTTPTSTTAPGVARPGVVDPLHRIRLEELVRIAEMHVVEIGGLPVAGIDGIKVAAVTRELWAHQFLNRHRSLFELVAAAVSTTSAESDQTIDESEQLMMGIMKMMGPSMLAMQLGGMAGHLARRSFGHADLPLPSGAETDQLTFVTENIAQFAADWSLPLDGLQMRLAIDELVMHAIMRIPHVAKMFSALTERHAKAVRVDTASIADRLSGIADPAELTETLGGAGAFGVLQSPELLRTANEITRLVTLVEGWCNHVGNSVARRLLGGDRRADEALRRRKLDPDDGTDVLASLVGIRLDQAMFDRGSAFIEGVFDRAGTDGLLQLWTNQEHLPTDSELDAPGLWLARLELLA